MPIKIALLTLLAGAQLAIAASVNPTDNSFNAPVSSQQNLLNQMQRQQIQQQSALHQQLQTQRWQQQHQLENQLHDNIQRLRQNQP